MKKIWLIIGLAILLAIGLTSTASTSIATEWVKDSVVAMENGQKTYDWHWLSPILQSNTKSNLVSMAISVNYTDYGRALKDLPSNIKRTVYILEIDLEANKYRFFSADYFDFNNNKVLSSKEYPQGTEWITAMPGTMAERWLEVARSAPKTTNLPKSKNEIEI